MHELPLLMALRVQGISPVERAAIAAGCSPEIAAIELAEFAEQELCTERGARGFALTAAGREELDKLLASEGFQGSETLHECYDRFLGLNKRVLALSSDWQVRREGGLESPNDHSDPGYDEEVIERLAQLHDSVRRCLERVAGYAERFVPYVARLDSCVERLRSGDRDAFTALLAESYHTVWFELHQDLMLTLGLKREE